MAVRNILAGVSAVQVSNGIQIKSDIVVNDVRAFEMFNGSDCMTSSIFTKADSIYPEALTLTVPFHDEDLVLDLSVDRSLFADDWKLVDGSTGEVITTDKEAYMCHYNGEVVGQPDSSVTISVCNDGGMNGLISTSENEIEIRPTNPNGGMSFLDSHIIYDMDDLILPDNLKYGHVENGFGDYSFLQKTSLCRKLRSAGVFNNDNSTAQAYMLLLVVASDANRMNAFSSQTAEALNTLSVVAQMAQRYANTNWREGNSLRVVLAEQVLNANLGGAPTSNLNAYLPQVAAYKGKVHPTAANLQGLTSFSSGGTIGVAYLAAMCGRSDSVGINNVGFTASTSTRGILLAHEAGHNFAMEHDQTNPNVMQPSLNAQAQIFTDFSVGQFLSKSAKSCLLGNSAKSRTPPLASILFLILLVILFLNF